MQCLYCEKKLGLFASRKRPFCSEQHEVAYNDEQAGLAMRRVMDPLFTEPIPKAPLQAGPRTSPAESEAVPAAAPPPVPLPIPPSRHAGATPPAAQSFVRQPGPLPRPLPAPSEPVTNVLFGLELAAAQARLPESTGSLLEYEPLEHQGTEEYQDFEQAAVTPEAQALAEETLAEEAPLEQAGVEEAAVEEEYDAVAPDSHRLHPAVEQEKPDWFEAEPGPESENVATAVSFETILSRSLPLDVPIETEPPVAQAPVGEPDSLPEATAETTVASTLEPEPEPAPPAGLLWPAALRPRPRNLSQAGDNAQLDAALDPPQLALRYPFADFTPAHPEPVPAEPEHVDPVHAESTYAVPDAPAKPEWSAQPLDSATLSDPARHAPLSLTTLPPLPETQIPVTGSARPGQAAACVFLEPRAAAAPQVAWKMFSRLREAPAKLRLPVPSRSGWEAILTSRSAETLDWTAPDSQRTLAAVTPEVIRACQPAVELPVEGASLRQRHTSLTSLPPAGLAWKTPHCAPVAPVLAAEEILTWAPAVGLAIRRELLDPKQRILDPRLSGMDGIQQPVWKRERPAAPLLRREEANKLDRVQVPSLPAEAERPLVTEVRKAAPLVLVRAVQFDRRRRYRPSSLVAESVGFQRVRAAAYIQIREPELRESLPSGGFAASVRLPWQGVRMKREARPLSLPVRLRPVVRTPELAA